MTRDELRQKMTKGFDNLRSHSAIWNHLMSEDDRRLINAFDTTLSTASDHSNATLDDVLAAYNQET